MKNLIPVCFAIFAGYSSFTNASVVNVISSDGLFAGNSLTAQTTVSQLDNNQIATNLSDNDSATYVFGSSNNGTTSARITLEFQDIITNQGGDDIAFYFMGGSKEVTTMKICFTDNCIPGAEQTAKIIDDYGVKLSDGTVYALSIISIDLSAFGFTSDQVLGQFSIDLIAGGYNRLAGVEGMSISEVPVPAAIWLFLSGLGLLGAFKRKQS